MRDDPEKLQRHQGRGHHRNLRGGGSGTSHMIVGIQECRCRVIGSASLKDKRRVVKSGLDRIRHRFNLSVAEVDFQDDRQLTTLAMVGVGSGKHVVERELRQALRLLENLDGLEVLDAEITYA
ncbi:MAG: DUF503 domain-containing protein [Thermoactinomycetaceae bacterium]|nr:DUF503 domain-containing protein [Bacillota bacterium]MBO2531731.1 DUF503 domain-containing protein [Thermoactinomycetaceae bacterium]